MKIISNEEVIDWRAMLLEQEYDEGTLHLAPGETTPGRAEKEFADNPVQMIRDFTRYYREEVNKDFYGVITRDRFEFFIEGDRMKWMDLKNAVENDHMSGPNNFTVLLFRLIMKADTRNRRKLGEVYPLEATMVDIFQNRCPMMCDLAIDGDGETVEEPGTSRVDYQSIENHAKKEIGEAE